MFPVINLGPLSIPAPGFILILGFWLGSVLVERKSKRFKVNHNLAEKVLWVCLLSGLIGAIKQKRVLSLILEFIY